MSYVPPFALIEQQYLAPSVTGSIRGAVGKVTLTEDGLKDIIRLFLQSIDVDEPWYRRTYPDVAEAIDAGDFSSAKQHFVENGYFEGRFPSSIPVDEEWYLKTYPDVADGIAKGEIISVVDHFQTHGYREGRRPTKAQAVS